MPGGLHKTYHKVRTVSRIKCPECGVYFKTPRRTDLDLIPKAEYCPGCLVTMTLRVEDAKIHPELYKDSPKQQTPMTMRSKPERHCYERGSPTFFKTPHRYVLGTGARLREV
jgi:hypothetical protein